MIRPYFNKVLVEVQDMSTSVGSFKFNTNSDFHKGKIVSIGKPATINNTVTEYDCSVGDIVTYKADNALYTHVEGDKTLEILEHISIISVEN